MSRLRNICVRERDRQTEREREREREREMSRWYEKCTRERKERRRYI